MQLEARLINRFWSKVDRRGDDDCWPWTGTKRASGYGLILVGGKYYPATRLSWQIANDADWPADRLACHHCDNPPCVNPSHLFAGTYSDNMSDMVRKGRRQDFRPALQTTHCRNGHPRTPESFIVIKGYRACCLCIAASRAKSAPPRTAPDPAIYGHGKLCVRCGHHRTDDYKGEFYRCRPCHDRRAGRRQKARRARRKAERS